MKSQESIELLIVTKVNLEIRNVIQGGLEYTLKGSNSPCKTEWKCYKYLGENFVRRLQNPKNGFGCSGNDKLDRRIIGTVKLTKPIPARWNNLDDHDDATDRWKLTDNRWLMI